MSGEDVNASQGFCRIPFGKEISMYSLYSYNGPIKVCGNEQSFTMSGQTRAENIRKARANLCFQFRQKLGLATHASLSLSHDPQVVTDKPLKRV